MTAYTAFAHVTADTGATTQDVTATSFGPVAAAMIVATNGTTNGSETTEAQLSIGFWVPSSSYRCLSLVSEDNKGTRTDTKCLRTKDNVLVLIDNAGVIIRKATLTAITNGIRINWFNSAGTATAPPAAWKLEVLLVGGADSRALIVDVAGPPVSGAGETVISSLDFQPDGLIFLGPGTFATSPSTIEGCAGMLGFATRAPTIKNSLISWEDPDNVTTTALTSIVSGSACAASAGGIGTDSCAVTAFSATGFTLANNNLVSVGPDTCCLALSIPGANWWTGTISSPTSTGNTTHSEPGFRPMAVILGLGLSANVDTTETDNDAGAFGVGFAGDNHHGSMTSGSSAIRSSDAVNLGIANSDTGSSPSAGPVRVLNGGGTLHLAADTPVWQPNGFQLNWTTVQASARRLPALVIGAEPNIITPNPLAVTLAVPSATRALLLSPSATAVSLAIPSAARALLLSPGAAAVTLAVPSATRQLLLTPDPAAVTLAIASVTRALLLSPDPVATALALPAATRALLLDPDPLAASLVLPSAERALLLSPDPVATTLALPAATRALLLEPDELEVLLVVPSIIAPINLTPDPLATTLTLEDITRALLLSPDPIATTLVTPSATRQLLLEPDALAVPLALPDATRALQLTPDPLGVPLVLPSPAVGKAILPNPLAVTLAAPAIDRALGILPDPLAIATAAPAATRALLLSPSPLALELVEPLQGTSAAAKLPDPLAIALTLPGIAVVGIDVVLQPDPLEIELAIPGQVAHQAKRNGMLLRSRAALATSRCSRAGLLTETRSRAAPTLAPASRAVP